MPSMLYLLALLPAAQDPAPEGSPPNMVLILADDFGVDLVGAYAEGTAPACTPSIDGLAAQGMLFRNAWTNPTCSPTRAAVLTGRYGFRTGIGEPIAAGTSLSLAELTIPEMLGYDSACLGKWHLAGPQQVLHPNQSGFGHFAGTILGVPDYFQWTKVTNGQSAQTTTYATTDTVDEAIAALGTMQEPWFLYTAFHAPHDPWHVPPSSLCASPPCANSSCGSLPPSPTVPEMVKAMTEAMDTEIGRLLSALEVADPDAYVVFMGDNGTAKQASEAPFLASHAKGSMYEGGVNVPLIVRGPGVVQAECAALVCSTDLFATFAELAGVAASAEDSVSMVPYFADPALSLRATVYTEAFSNGASLPFPDHRQAIREQRYKLIREVGQPDELYDLQADPFETTNLLPGLTPAEQQAFDFLDAELTALLLLPPEIYCTAGTSASGCQALVSASGSASATASSGFVLATSGLEGAKDGLFFFGTNGRQAIPWGNGTSYRCVVPPTARADLLAGLGTVGVCDGSFAQDLNALWCPTCPKPAKNPGAGAVVQAQLWYRDPLNTSNRSTSFSDAVEFTLAP